MGTKCCDQDNLGSDDKVCATCGNKITDLSLLRCPRCFSSLIPLGCNGACRGCSQKNERGGSAVGTNR